MKISKIENLTEYGDNFLTRFITVDITMITGFWKFKKTKIYKLYMPTNGSHWRFLIGGKWAPLDIHNAIEAYSYERRIKDASYSKRNKDTDSSSIAR